jgi:hypothetical protein
MSPFSTCDKYLCYQRRYPDPEQKLPMAIPMGFPTDQLMSTHEFPLLVLSLIENIFLGQ